MEKAKTSISRRSMFSSALAAGAALAIPAVALAKAETLNDKGIETLLRPLEILGKALHSGQIDVKFPKSKTGHVESSKFTIWLDGNEGLELMGAIFAGTVFAGLCTAEEIIAKLEKNIASKAA